MVKYLVFFIFVHLTAAQPPDATSVFTEVQWDNIYENQPIDGFVSVTHDSQFKVDEQSFTLNSKPLKVTFDKEVKFSPSSPLVISIYKFTIPGMAKGLQILPEISVKVNGKLYKSPPISFQVQGLEKQLATLQPSLKLEVIATDQPLYPGSRTQVGYRYIYNTNIELTAEYLPLLEPENFRKIGDKDIKDTEQGIVTIHTILQNIEAIKPGVFKFGPSVVEGNAYQEKGGKKIYLQPKLLAEAPVVTLTVKDFPDSGKPPSFNGAVGQFSLVAAMESANQIRLGDKVELRLEITGEGQLENVLPPDLCCQPGFSGNFRTSDLPPAGVISGNTKTFHIEIYPLSSSITTVPPIEFSFFNPTTETYESSVSPGIPIKILPSPKGEKVEAAANREITKPIEGIYSLTVRDLKNHFFGTYWVFGLIPAGLAVIFFQYALVQARQQVRQEEKSSKTLLNDALEEKNEGAFFTKLRQAFQILLFEKGILETPQGSIEDLPTEFSALKKLFAKADEARFSKQEEIDLNMFAAEAKDLFKKYSNL